jgi:hypothetical protein
MPRISSIAVSTGLIGSGVLAWAFAGRPLVTNPDLNSPLNPLGINGSPYGEVFAMAMQGPIDTHFHGVLGGGPSHNHADGESCESCNTKSPEKSNPASGNRFQNLLASLEKAVVIRTNPKSASEAHKRYLRRQVEDKLRFAYQLDPSHYANYNSLHFFLTEPQLGTRPELTPSAAKLAEDTIQYCLKQDNDPRPALTAAAATSNILELMFNDQRNAAPRFNTAQMRQYLNLLDHCINRYVFIAKQWDETKNWDLLSPQRITECDERFQYICKFREAAIATIDRFDGKSHPAQASN